jgi:hypothetical protein
MARAIKAAMATVNTTAMARARSITCTMLRRAGPEVKSSSGRSVVAQFEIAVRLAATEEAAKERTSPLMAERKLATHMTNVAADIDRPRGGRPLEATTTNPVPVIETHRHDVARAAERSQEGRAAGGGSGSV